MICFNTNQIIRKAGPSKRFWYWGGCERSERTFFWDYALWIAGKRPCSANCTMKNASRLHFSSTEISKVSSSKGAQNFQKGAPDLFQLGEGGATAPSCPHPLNPPWKRQGRVPPWPYVYTALCLYGLIFIRPYVYTALCLCEPVRLCFQISIYSSYSVLKNKLQNSRATYKVHFTVKQTGQAGWPNQHQLWTSKTGVKQVLCWSPANYVLISIELCSVAFCNLNMAKE